jgi:hypothetical protein
MVIYYVTSKRQPHASTPTDWKVLLPYLLLPNLPDCDFVLSYIVYHDTHILHGGISHTLASVILLSVLVAPWKIFGSPLRTFLISAALIGSHLLLDLVSGPEFLAASGRGVMLLYPLSEMRIALPALLIGPQHPPCSNYSALIISS